MASASLCQTEKLDEFCELPEALQLHSASAMRRWICFLVACAAPPSAEDDLNWLGAHVDVSCGEIAYDTTPTCPTTVPSCMQDALAQHKIGRFIEKHAVGPDYDVHTFTTREGGVSQFLISGDAHEGEGTIELRCTGLVDPAPPSDGRCHLGTGCQLYAKCC